MTDLEAVLEAAVRRELELPEPATASPAAVTASFKQATAHVRVSPVALGLPAGPEGVAAVRRALEALPYVTRVGAGRDIVQARLATDFLVEHVVADVRSAGDAYARSDEGAGRRVVVTFSDPNMNKPLHVGHLRNNLLGMSIARLLAMRGYAVERHTVHSDWGVHIAQAVVGYLRWGDGTLPADHGMRPDAFVGHFYARFHQENRGVETPDDSDDAVDQTPLEQEAAALLRSLDAGTADPAAAAAMRRMTDWCEEGVAATYARIGSRFDRVYRERDRLAEARAFLADALADGRCARRADGSVFVDLSDDDLPDLTLVRRDGTLVVYSQWLGNDLDRYREAPHAIVQLAGYEWKPGQMQYLAAARRLGAGWVDAWRHVHYGMVRLAGGGKMSSRSGTIVGTEELLDELAAGLRAGWTDPDPGVAADAVAETLAVALAKFHLLRPPRVNDMAFDVDALLGDGVARFAAVVRTLAWLDVLAARDPGPAGPSDDAVGDLLATVNAFPATVGLAAGDHEPSVVVRYVEQLADAAGRQLRRSALTPAVAGAVATVLRAALRLLAVELPEDLTALPAPFARRTTDRRDHVPQDVPLPALAGSA